MFDNIKYMRSSNTRLFLFGDMRNKKIINFMFPNETIEIIHIERKFPFKDVFLFSFLSILFSIHYLFSNYCSKYHFKLNFKIAYVYGILKVINPKVIISFDGLDTPIFGILANYIKSTKFIGMYPYQMRKVVRDNTVPSPAHYHVFGLYDKENMVSLGQHDSKISISGSLNASVFYSLFYKNLYKTKTKYDICIISTVLFKEDTSLEKNENAILLCLGEYVVNNPDIKICIALRPHSVGNEQKGLMREKKFYLDKLPDKNIEFIESDVDNFSTYKASTLSRVTIQQLSNVGYEVMGWGGRVLFCQPYDFRIRVPSDLYYSITENDSDKFRKYLDELLSISDDLYMKNIKSNIRNYCYFDKHNLAYNQVVKQVNNIILDQHE
jgi:hypothetical protein